MVSYASSFPAFLRQIASASSNAASLALVPHEYFPTGSAMRPTAGSTEDCRIAFPFSDSAVRKIARPTDSRRDAVSARDFSKHVAHERQSRRRTHEKMGKLVGHYTSVRTCTVRKFQSDSAVPRAATTFRDLPHRDVDAGIKRTLNMANTSVLAPGYANVF